MKNSPHGYQNHLSQPIEMNDKIKRTKMLHGSVN